MQLRQQNNLQMIESIASFNQDRERIGIQAGLTGIPVFIFLLEGVYHPSQFKFQSEEDLTGFIHGLTSHSDRLWVNQLKVFFETGGNTAYVVALPFQPGQEGRLTRTQYGKVESQIFSELPSLIDHTDMIAFPQLTAVLHPRDAVEAISRMSLKIKEQEHFVLLIDPPKQMLAEDTDQLLYTFNAPQTIGFFPWMEVQDQVVCPSVVATSLIQQTDAQRGIPHLPSNHPQRIALKPICDLNPTQKGNLLKENWNFFEITPLRELNLIGGYIKDAPNGRKEMFSSVRTLLAIQAAVHRLCHPFVFENTSQNTADSMGVTLRTFFQNYSYLLDSKVDTPFKIEISEIKHTSSIGFDVQIECCLPMTLESMSFNLKLES